MSQHPQAGDAQSRFRELVAQVTQRAAGRPLDEALQAELNTWAGRDSALYAQLAAACRQGVAEGWMCNREAGGIRFGRVLKPAPELNGFSVDVVEMDRIRGPHHVHPNGEIDLLMPLDGEPRFDGSAEAWKVYPAGSAHHPTVSDGKALVLYLLPQGAIQFTPATA